MRIKCTLIALLALFCLTTTETNAITYSSVVVYGDSLSDNGSISGTVRSNGKVAVEYLADSLGVPLVDFAFVGATTGIGNYGDGGSVTSLGSSNLPGMLPMYAATKEYLSPLLADGLFVVWAGPNDFLAPAAEDIVIDDTGKTIGNIIQRAVLNELAIVYDLVGMGATSILVPGMPDLGITPYFQGLGPDYVTGGAALTDAFNTILKALLPEGVMFFDTAALMRSVVADPGAYGFTNVTEACFVDSTLCGDPNEIGRAHV